MATTLSTMRGGVLLSLLFCFPSHSQVEYGICKSLFALHFLSLEIVSLSSLRNFNFFLLFILKFASCLCIRWMGNQVRVGLITFFFPPKGYLNPNITMTKRCPQVLFPGGVCGNCKKLRKWRNLSWYLQNPLFFVFFWMGNAMTTRCSYPLG